MIVVDIQLQYVPNTVHTVSYHLHITSDTFSRGVIVDDHFMPFD